MTSPFPLETVFPPGFQFLFYVETPAGAGLLDRVSEEARLTQSKGFFVFWKDGITFKGLLKMNGLLKSRHICIAKVFVLPNCWIFN